MYELPLPRDVVRYIVSEYIPYTECVPLSAHIAHLHISLSLAVHGTHVHLISSYIPYLELLQLQEHTESLYADPTRVRVRYQGVREGPHSERILDIEEELIDDIPYVERVYHVDTMISETYYDVDGNISGTARNWYDDGTIEYVGTYQHGVQHGTCTNYYRNGTKSVEQNFVRGALHGTSTEWDNTGVLISVAQYDNAKLVSTMSCSNNVK